MQIDDILKAAIQDAGLEFFNATTAYSSPANSINSSESSLNQFSLDDDFTLTDLDWNLLDQSEESPVASTSISPASQCSVQSPYNPIQANTTTPVQAQPQQQQAAEIPCTTIAEDTDPFILALQELDEHNSKLGDQAYSNFDANATTNNTNKTHDLNNNEITYKNNNISDPKRLTVEPSLTHLIKPIARPITQLAVKSKAELLSKPQTKIVSFNQSMMKPQVCQVVGKSSDLTSLINYRATSVINKPTNKSSLPVVQSTQQQQTSVSALTSAPLVKITKITAPLLTKPPQPQPTQIITKQSTTTTQPFNRTPSSLVNPIKVINLSQVQKKNLQEKLSTNTTKLNHKVIQINTTPHTGVIGPNNTFSNTTANINGSSVKITKVVSSRPPLINTNNNINNQNVIYLNKNTISVNNTNTSKSDASAKSVYLTANTGSNKQPIQNTYLNQQPPTMRLVGNCPSSTGQLVTNTTATSTNKIPRFYTTSPKIISAQYFNSSHSGQATSAGSPIPAANNNNGLHMSPMNSSSNHHINLLNSNINRYLNQSKLVNLPSITNTTNGSAGMNAQGQTVTLNPRYLMSINNASNIANGMNIMANNNNNNSGGNGGFNNGPADGAGVGHHSMPSSANNFNNYFVQEQDEDVVVDEEEELGHAETYANYMPSKLQIGRRHPDPIVETSSLASVEPPEVWYKLAMQESVYKNGALSALQLEAITYSCQKHADFLPNNHRCGFLIGDGAGVGKGRTIAGIIYENYLLGRKKALWLSVSNDLKYDAERDFSDIGASRIQVHSLNKLKYTKISSKQNSKIKKGVIFSTYSSLIGESQHKTTKKKYSSRLKQLLQWLGGDSFDGLIVFDECHKAKNLVPNGSAKPTKTGLAVLELQEKLPNARIVYASATGASEPKNMAYMVRLGLWGTGTPFADFNDFIQSIEKRGVGAMEIVAMDMKLRGMYMARQLSFSGVTFKIEEIPLKREYVRMYNDAVKLWVEMKEKFQEAIELIDTEGKLKKTVWGQFWSSHQRFFKYLCMACKVPRVVDLAQKALRNKKCVVIGLQSTGEARTMEQLDEFGEINDFISTARGVLQNLVEKHFPTVENLSNSSSSLSNTELKQLIEAKKLQRSKESKNSQKVNDILHRLSSYTNTNNSTNEMANKKRLKLLNAKKSKRKHMRSSSMSSSSSLNSSNCNNDSNFYSSCESELLKSDGESGGDSFDSQCSEFESSIDENNHDDLDLLDDPFKIHETCNHDLEDFETFIDSKVIQEHNDSRIFSQTDSWLRNSTNSTSPLKAESLFDMSDFDLGPAGCGNAKNIESDDSDSLFSITKSVPVQSLMTNRTSGSGAGKHRQARSSAQASGTGGHSRSTLNSSKRKKVKSQQRHNSTNQLFGENEDEDDDDLLYDNGRHDIKQDNTISDDIELNDIAKVKSINSESESDDDFRLPTKRIRNHNQTECDFLSNVNTKAEEDTEFSLTSFQMPQKAEPRPRPTKPHEILDYICEMKRDLLNSIRSLGRRLPANTLDELIDLLDGPDHVAEMTGRKGRIVHRSNTTNAGEAEDGKQGSNYVYETRNETDVPVELMNVSQKEKFMNGQKLIAIISEAASSGISLQANRRNANQFRRVHITIELPWSADRAIQQFGRTHRSNQVSAPEYVFLISELAGEKRFASTVAKRLESLGALTHGDRRATESRDLSRFNIDNKYGRAALENVIKSICNLEKPMARLPKKYTGNFMADARQALHGVGMIVCNKNGQSAYPDKDYNSINKFLNRLLGVPVELQNSIFQFFSDILAAVILEAKRTGKWDMGILDLGSNNEVVFRKDTKFYVLDSKVESQRRVEMHTVLVERGLSWEKALEMYKKTQLVTTNSMDENIENEGGKQRPQGFYISNQVKNNHRVAILAVAFVPVLPPGLISKEDPKGSDCSFLAIYRPNTGLQVRQETPESLLKKYKRVSPAEAKFHWHEQYVKSAQQCTHVYRQAHCVNIRNCEVGLRTRRFHILAGSVLTVWTRVENLLSSLTGSSQFRLQIIRVKTDDNQKIVGCVIPTMCLKQTDALLNSMSSKSFVQTHANNLEATTAGTMSMPKLDETTRSDSFKRPPVTMVTGSNITPVVAKTKAMVKVEDSTASRTVANGILDFEKSFENINYDFT